MTETTVGTAVTPVDVLEQQWEHEAGCEALLHQVRRHNKVTHVIGSCVPPERACARCVRLWLKEAARNDLLGLPCIRCKRPILDCWYARPI